MYTNDERFAILHSPGSDTWTLQIKFVQRRDHGMYECQVSDTKQTGDSNWEHGRMEMIKSKRYLSSNFLWRLYVCFLCIYQQISTATGIISHFVNLQVVVPEAFILGSGELHVDMGSTINLVCIIEKVSEHQ
jgi:hypothetical protein